MADKGRVWILSATEQSQSCHSYSCCVGRRGQAPPRPPSAQGQRPLRSVTIIDINKHVNTALATKIIPCRPRPIGFKAYNAGNPQQHIQCLFISMVITHQHRRWLFTSHNFLIEEMASSEHGWLEAHVNISLRRTSIVHGNRQFLLWLPMLLLLSTGRPANLWACSPAANGLLPWQDLTKPISMKELLVAECRTHKLCAHKWPTRSGSVRTTTHYMGFFI